MIESNPEYFVYNSKHYIIRNKNDYELNNQLILSNTPCEVQIRTLAQHAYAEISHDLVYKKKTELPPKAKRMLARSVAFNEAVDNEYKGIYEVINKRNELYVEYVNVVNEKYDYKFNDGKLSKSIFEDFRNLVEQDGVEKIKKYIDEHKCLLEMISRNVQDYSIIFDEIIIVLLYYLVSNHSSVLNERWDYDDEIIKVIYSDLGIAYDNYY